MRKSGLDQEFEILEDPACIPKPIFHGKKKMLPLYRKYDSKEPNTHNTPHMDACWVDMIIKKRNRDEVPLVIEIDESSTSPHHICGKFLTAAISEYYDNGERQFPLSDNTLFIQVVKAKITKNPRSQMIDKWKAIENFINSEPKFKESKISKYMVFWSSGNVLINQHGYDFIDCIRKHMKSFN